MSFTKVLFRYGTWPVLFFGFGGVVVPSRMIGWFIIGVPCCWVARP
jgi:hypothetical protein